MYGLSFSSDFWGTEDAEPSERPTSVYQALASLSAKDWASLARDVFSCPPENLDLQTVIQRIRETDTCRNLDPPVEVWIDPDGYHTILIHEETP